MTHETKHHGSASRDVSFSDEISTTTLVKLLVRKGILSTKEVLEEERLTRLHTQAADAKIDHRYEKPKKRSRFKKWASKHKWSRRMTARLFGWEWKRSKSTDAAG